MKMTWILKGRKWRLRRQDGTYARGRLVSQGLGGEIQVQYQWENVNGQWYAFDEYGCLKTGLFYDAGSGAWYYTDENGRIRFREMRLQAGRA